MVRTAALIGALLLCAPAAAKESSADRMRAMLLRPPQSLEALITITGDALDPAISISTHGVTAITNKGWIASTTIEPSFLRAFIDKKTGAITAQIYHVATYGGRGFQNFDRATYDAPHGLVETKADRIAIDVSCYRSSCTHYEDIGIPISFADLEAAADKFDPNNPMTALRYRLFGQGGEKIDEAVPGNEIVAFVAVARRMREKIR